MGQKTQEMFDRMMEEKYVYSYKKLVVPMAMRSIYWKYFGFPATDEGDILTKIKIVCILCKTQIAYNRNTSNLRMHLQNKHNGELLQLEANSSHINSKGKRTARKLLANQNNLTVAPYIYTTPVDGTVKIEDVQFITESNISLQNLDDSTGTDNENMHVMEGSPSGVAKQNVAIILPEENSNSQLQNEISGKTVSNAILDFIILDLELPDVVEGRGFQRLLATLCSPCEIPSKLKIEEELLPKLYDTFKDMVQSNISCRLGNVALSLEEWNSLSGETFLTISIHFQQSADSVLETKVLTTVHCPLDYDSTYWSATLDQLYAEWDIKSENVTAIITATTQNELLKAIIEKGITAVPCLAHSFQLCAFTCFEQSEVAAIINKCRAALGQLSRSSMATSALSIQDHLLKLEGNPLKMDYPCIWTSTYLMLEQLLLRKSVLPAILDTIDCFNKDSFTLIEDEWKTLEDLVALLEPLKVTIMMLSEEKAPLISLLKPLLWQFSISHFKQKETDSITVKMLKGRLSKILLEKYSSVAVNNLLDTATILDPRFKSFPYATEEEKSSIMTPVKDMLVNFIKQAEKDGEIVTESTIKKSRLSEGMEFLLGDVYAKKTGMSAEERANLELIQYRSESSASLDNCPLQWWSSTSAKCPNLIRLALKYIGLPACVMLPFRIPLDSQVLLDMRRANLAPRVLDKLLFLHSNHTL